MLFKEITGLEDLKIKLLKAIDKGHIAHAFLFSGSEGSGNLAMALAFLTYLNCENPHPDDACGICPACHKNARLIHPDVQFTFPVAALEKKEALSSAYLSDWRNFIIQDPFNNAAGWSIYSGSEKKQLNISREESRQIIKGLALKPFESKYKVSLIWLPEYMHPNAANALLKIFEEPPENTIFLLVSNERLKILSTILSRMQIVHVRQFTDEEIVQILVEKHFIEKEKAIQIAPLVDGNIIQALNLVREVEDNSHTLFRDWMRVCYQRNYSQILEITEKFTSLSKISQLTLFHYGLNILRETLIFKYDQSEFSRFQGEELSFINKFSSTFSISGIENLIHLFTEACFHIERNANARILFLDISLTNAGLFVKNN